MLLPIRAQRTLVPLIAAILLTACGTSAPRVDELDDSAYIANAGKNRPSVQEVEALWGNFFSAMKTGGYIRDDRRGHVELGWHMHAWGRALVLQFRPPNSEMETYTLIPNTGKHSYNLFFRLKSDPNRLIGSATLVHANKLEFAIKGMPRWQAVQLLANGKLAWTRPDHEYRFQGVKILDFMDFTHEMSTREMREKRERDAAPEWLQALAGGLEVVAEDARQQEEARRQQGEIYAAASRKLSSEGFFARNNQRASSQIPSASTPAADHPNEEAELRAEVERKRRDAERAAAARKREAERLDRILAQERRDREEEQAREARERTVRDYLARLRSQMRLAAKKCGKDDVRIGGVLPAGPKVLSTVKVHYTAHCPGNERTSGILANFLGDGFSCVGSDMTQVTLNCKPEDANVVVDKVTRN